MLELKKISGYRRTEIPKEGETIFDDNNAVELAPLISRYEITRRENEKVWVVDLIGKKGGQIYLKLPIEMTEEHLKNYMQPLKDALNKQKED